MTIKFTRLPYFLGALVLAIFLVHADGVRAADANAAPARLKEGKPGASTPRSLTNRETERGAAIRTQALANARLPSP